jgi:restriction system protein
MIIDKQLDQSKRARLEVLARKRQQSKWEGYKNIGDYNDGQYECDFVSPYTKIASNIDSEVFVMLQDWAFDDFLRGPLCELTVQYGRTPTRATNKRLDDLVLKYFDVSICEIFASNLFPFIKPKSMSAKIPAKDLALAAKEFALPQIEIVAPRLVVALGLDCFNARRALNIEPSHTIAHAIEDPIPFHDSMIWCQAHTSPLGQNMRNRGGIKNDRVSADWQEMSDWFRNESNANKSKPSGTLV